MCKYIYIYVFTVHVLYIDAVFYYRFRDSIKYAKSALVLYWIKGFWNLALSDAIRSRMEGFPWSNSIYHGLNQSVPSSPLSPD